jgi:hypothetical protein
MISGFVVKSKLPLEFAAEADKLLTLKLEGSVGSLDSTILEIKDLQVSINENEILKFELKVNRAKFMQ